jgi:peroxiredoxin Q/BCP
MKHLKVGDKAPLFSGLDQNGKKITLHDFKGKKLVVYFYPKDNTPGCTNQACNLRDNDELLKQQGISVVGVSMDNDVSHRKFIDKYHLTFPLIADADRKVIELFGVWGPKVFMGKKYDGIHRTTFLINEEQRIVGIIDKPNTKAHAEEILEIFK